MSLFTLIVLLPKRIAIILVGCAACVLIGTKTSAWKGPKHLLQIDLQIAKNLPETLNEILKPNTGRKQSLPTIAYHVWQFQIKHKVTSYSLDGEKFQDQMINQRVIESIWPAKLEPTAKYKFVLPDVLAKYNNCRIIDQRDDVALIHCP